MNKLPYALAAALLAVVVSGIVVAQIQDEPIQQPQTLTANTGRYLTGQEAATALCQGAQDLGTPGWDSTYGCGRLDICGAFNKAATITSNPIYVCDTPVPSVGGTYELIKK